MMMHISGQLAMSSLSGVLPGDNQPNAVDLRLDKVFEIGSSMFIIEDDNKTHRTSIQLYPNETGWFFLKPGSYEVIMKNKIQIHAGEAGWVITRSTLNRNGVFLTSGLYDSGYQGKMAGVLHVTCGSMAIKEGTRIGQFLLFKAESLNMYNGSYGAGSEHDKKYD